MRMRGMVRIGEGRSERLGITPAQFRRALHPDGLR